MKNRVVKPCSLRSSLWLLAGLLLFCSAKSLSQTPQPKDLNQRKPKSLLAYVIDERFSVVRTRPDATAHYLRRLRVGHRVFIPLPSNETAAAKFRRVTVSRNLTGWIMTTAIAAPGVRGDDERLFGFATTQPNDKALIALSILTAHFNHSPRRAEALLQLGKAAEQVAGQLSIRANRKLSKDEMALPEGIGEEDLFANYRGLDHFASFGIRFVYRKDTDRFLYRGDAYEEILRRYPKSPAAEGARTQLRMLREEMKSKDAGSVLRSVGSPDAR